MDALIIVSLFAIAVVVLYLVLSVGQRIFRAVARFFRKEPSAALVSEEKLSAADLLLSKLKEESRRAKTPSTWREIVRKELIDEILRLGELHALESERIKEKAEKARETSLGFIPPPPSYYWITVFSYLCIQVVIASIATHLMSVVETLVIPVNIGVTILLLQALHLVGSLRQIEVSDLAGFTLFGRPWFVPKSGLYIVPVWIMKSITASRNYKDERFPGPADKIYRVSSELQEKTPGGDMPPKDTDWVRPIFALTGEPRLTETDKEELKNLNGVNPLDRQLYIEVSYFVRYRPEEYFGGIFRIARNLSAETGDIDVRIKDLIREQSERDLKAIIARYTTATINENWDLINWCFAFKLRLAVMRLGIDVDRNGSGLDDLNPSHKTSEDLANVTRELFKKQTAITKAEGEGIAIQKKKEGDAAGELAILNAKATGLKKMKEDLQVHGRDVLAAQATRDILNNTDVILAGGESGMRDVMALVKGAQTAFASGDHTKTESEKESTTVKSSS